MYCGKTNTLVYTGVSPYIVGSVKNDTFVSSNERFKNISENKELFGMFIMLAVSVISMTYGMLYE